MKFLKLKKIREKLKEKWDDFIYLNINIPKWNILFLKRNSYPIIPWDMSESVIDIIFSQYREFYEKFSIQTDNERFGCTEINNYVKDYNKVKQSNIFSKKEIESYYNSIQTLKKDFNSLKEIHKYISINRVLNQTKFDSLLEEKFNGYLIDSSKEVKKDNLKINWVFTPDGLAKTKITVVSSKNSSLFNFEKALRDKDTEFAKKILDLRDYLWD